MRQMQVREIVLRRRHQFDDVVIGVPEPPAQRRRIDDEVAGPSHVGQPDPPRRQQFIDSSSSNGGGETEAQDWAREIDREFDQL
jgi:hypothetical protein